MAVLESYLRSVMSGRARGPLASALRGVTAAVEPVYTAAVTRRNRAFDSGRREVVDLGRPTISVGNLSAGGTGKTPVVAFLVRELARRGRRPSVLMRGYKRAGTAKSDEQAELESLLGTGIPVIANPDRVIGAREALAARPETDVFILDDGFQHRRAKRQLDVVLVSATQGLCDGRVLPRGLLREPVGGLARADVVVLTRVDQVLSNRLADLEREVRKNLRAGVPIVRCRHLPTEVVSTGGERLAPEAIKGRSLYAVVGTGDPEAFVATVEALGVRVAGCAIFADHHRYTARDRDTVTRAARAVGAEALITTGKDAVKLVAVGPGSPPEAMDLLTLRIAAEFQPGEGEQLISLATAACSPSVG